MRKHKRRKSKHYPVRLIKELIKFAKEDSLKKLEPSKIESDEILLTEIDRITHIRRVDNRRTILEVVNVSYETKIDDKWITIVHYDSTHGFLHRHLRIALNNPEEIINTTAVKKKGTVQVWYTWAIKDVLLRYLEYRKSFIKRSKSV